MKKYRIKRSAVIVENNKVRKQLDTDSKLYCGIYLTPVRQTKARDFAQNNRRVKGQGIGKQTQTRKD